MADLAPVAESLVAIGTLVLAYLAYGSLRENRKQLSLISSQTAIARSRLQPYLLVKEPKFDGNQLKLSIENLGLGYATWLAIQASFYLVEERSYADPVAVTPISRAQVRERQSRGLTAWGRFQPIEKSLSYANHRNVLPVSMVTFFVNKEANDSLLRPRESGVFSVEPFFGFEIDRGTENQSWQGLAFGDFREFLDGNVVRFVGLDFHVVCKDAVDKDVPSERICRFVMDLRKHQTLEDAFLEKRTFGFTPIGLKELTRSDFSPGEMYYHMETSRSNYES